MRKSAIGILLLMCSCTTTLPLDIGQGERVLMLNAQWDSADQEHLAYAGLSAQAALKPLDEACVRCFVDGSPVALADHSIGNVSNQACFSLQADLPPGSRLRLELEQGSERAGSEIVVPVKAGEMQRRVYLPKGQWETLDGRFVDRCGWIDYVCRDIEDYPVFRRIEE